MKKYIGQLNIEFLSKDANKTMTNLTDRFIKDLENEQLILTDYNYCPKDENIEVQLGRHLSLLTRSSISDNFLTIAGVLSDLDFDLETISMYGNEEDFNKYIKDLKNIIKSTTKLRRELTEE